MNPALDMPLQGVQALDAGAGTGKTYSIALLHLRMILAGVAIERILVTTFTETAAAELRERLRRRLAEARDALDTPPTDENLRELLDRARQDTDRAVLESRIDQALSGFDLAPVRTIHGFCHLLLRDYALELGADDTEELTAEDPSLDRIAGDYVARWVAGNHAEEAPPKWLVPAQLKRIAAKTREYNIAPPKTLTREKQIARAAKAWRAEADCILDEAAALWRSNRAAIADDLKKRVEEDAIASGVFDGATKKETRTWAKLDNAGKAVDEILSPDYERADYHFPNLGKKLLPDDLLKAASPGRAAEIRTWIDGQPFFAAWARVYELPVLEEVREAADSRFHLSDFLARVSSAPRRRHVLFSDLINAVFDNLANPFFTEAVRDRFDAVMVDECQDTDARQIEIFRRLFSSPSWLTGGSGPRCLVWVGDPKQSIYRFRGADIDTYLRAKNDAATPLPLDTNFRSDEPLVEAVNALFMGPAGGTSAFESEIAFMPSQAREKARIAVPGHAAPPPAMCLHTWSEPGEARTKTHLVPVALRDCAEAIAALLKSNLQMERESPGKRSWSPVYPGDLAVLTRQRRDLEIIRHELNRRGIPSAYRTDQSVYDSDEARDIGLLLQALAAPRLSALRAALATPLLGLSVVEAAQLDETRLAEAQTRLADLRMMLERDGILAVMFSVLREADSDAALARIAGMEDGERRLTNYIQIAELLQEAWQYDHARSAESLKDHLDRVMADDTGRSVGEEEAAIRLETDAPAVILSTIHGAKGLQYPIVFLPTIWAGMKFQDPVCLVRHEEDGQTRLLLPGDADWRCEVAQEKVKEAAERMRLLYVAFTRAKHQVHLWWGPVKGAEHNALSRLFRSRPGGEEPPIDEDHRAAFAAALSRRAGATHDMVEIGETPRWAGNPRAAEAREAGKDEVALAGRMWTRGTLSAAPLSASYSALIRRHTEAYRADDEFADTEEEMEEPDSPPPDEDETRMDVLAPFEAGNILGDRVHHAFESAMTAENIRAAGEIFVETLAADLPGLLRTIRRADPPEIDPTRIDANRIAASLWRRTAGAWIHDRSAAFADLFARPRAAEWAYTLPQHPGFNPASLADALRRHAAGTPWGGSDYVKRIEQLGFLPLSGYFEGIVDLFGRLPDDRWLLIDYKSNRLDHYGPASLEQAMAGSHYLLQALLYTVAAHRWLSHCIKDWSYERDFAGVAYLFLRGMDEKSDRGVWTARPPEALVVAIENLLCRGVMS